MKKKDNHFVNFTRLSRSAQGNDPPDPLPVRKLPWVHVPCGKVPPQHQDVSLAGQHVDPPAQAQSGMTVVEGKASGLLLYNLIGNGNTPVLGRLL